MVLERGSSCEMRASRVASFWNDGVLDGECNVLYGEGGAGLFSDGKLTARSKDRPRIRRFLSKLVACGAPSDIVVDAEPHLGSDVLLRIVPRLRRMIEELGGEFRFDTCLRDLEIEDRRLRAVLTSSERIPTDSCILATGHSARDVYELLYRANVLLSAKAIAVGVRLELPQEDIDRARFGSWAGHPRLGAASFRATRRGVGGLRDCYTFCMCPGGQVIACASSTSGLTTNGMSLSRRSGLHGNAAFIVPVDPEDFGTGETAPSSPLAGLTFQNELERRAFLAGGGDYSLPAQLLVDFLADRPAADSLPQTRSCRRAVPAALRLLLPPPVTETLVASIPPMLTELDGRTTDGVLLYAAETRSSSPVRVVRDDTGQSPTCRGLFPAGEGAGYAGGIVSSAVDGMRAAEACLCRPA